MALGKAEVSSPLEAETAVNKFWVNNYATLVDEIKEKLGEEEGRKLAYNAYHKAVFNSCSPGWEKMKGSNSTQCTGLYRVADHRSRTGL